MTDARIEYLRSEIARCDEAIESGKADGWWHIDRDRLRQELDGLLGHGAAVSPTAAISAKEDMANVGEALMEVLRMNAEHPRLKGWAPADCPSEIVTDLLNDFDDELAAAHATIHQLGENAAKAAGEVERLREALGRIANDFDRNRHIIQSIARAALTEPSERGEAGR